MAKTRLTQWLRDKMLDKAKEQMVVTKEKAALDKAYAKCAPLVRKVVIAKFPVSDMDILAKYDLIRIDECIKLRLTAGGIVGFNFEQADAVRVPHHYGCGSRIYEADEKLTKAHEDWSAAKDALDAAIAAKTADYRALISGSRYLEEIEAVWPGASFIRPLIGRNLPATLSPDIIARVTADVAAQKKAA
ncbi:MAG TPA: hypothetical protein VND94_00720 [Terriglobia bacterium]|nr:hypothetical protein [Terriglobia bacterium]